MQTNIQANINDDRNYAVYFVPAELSLFDHWFARLEKKLAIKINGNLYRFNSEQEKAFFVFGMAEMQRMLQPSNNAGARPNFKARITAAGNRILSLIN